MSPGYWNTLLFWPLATHNLMLISITVSHHTIVVYGPSVRWSDILLLSGPEWNETIPRGRQNWPLDNLLLAESILFFLPANTRHALSAQAFYHPFLSVPNTLTFYRCPAANSPILMSSTPLGGWIMASSYWHFHWSSRLICPFSTPSTVSPSWMGLSLARI